MSPMVRLARGQGDGVVGRSGKVRSSAMSARRGPLLGDEAAVCS